MQLSTFECCRSLYESTAYWNWQKPSNHRGAAGEMGRGSGAKAGTRVPIWVQDSSRQQFVISSQRGGTWVAFAFSKMEVANGER